MRTESVQGTQREAYGFRLAADSFLRAVFVDWLTRGFPQHLPVEARVIQISALSPQPITRTFSGCWNYDNEASDSPTLQAKDKKVNK